MIKCLNCGKPITATPGKRAKKYCDAACRSAHWKKENPDKVPVTVKFVDKEGGPITLSNGRRGEFVFSDGATISFVKEGLGMTVIPSHLKPISRQEHDMIRSINDDAVPDMSKALEVINKLKPGKSNGVMPEGLSKSEQLKWLKGNKK